MSAGPTLRPGHTSQRGWITRSGFSWSWPPCHATGIDKSRFRPGRVRHPRLFQFPHLPLDGRATSASGKTSRSMILDDSPPIPRTAKGFSLVELLTVVVLLTIVASMVIPALNKSNSLTGEGSKLVGILDLARQTAISDNTMTAVVLLAAGADRNRVFTILELATVDSSGNTIDPRWVQTRKWESFATGIVADTSPSPLPLASAQSVTPPLPDNLPYKGRDFTTSEYSVVIFRPGGNIFKSSGVPVIQLIEGMINADGSVLYTRPKAPGLPANVFKVCVLPTGRFKIERNN